MKASSYWHSYCVQNAHIDNKTSQNDDMIENVEILFGLVESLKSMSSLLVCPVCQVNLLKVCQFNLL